MQPSPTAYLAGPAVFHPAAPHLFTYLKKVCRKHGLVGVAPVDGDTELAALPPEAKAAAIRQANIAKIIACDVVIACISPFRGPGADPGTAWEMGYAEALGKPVVAWCEDKAAYVARVPHDRDGDGRPFCRQHGMLVEDFGLVDNLMLAAGPVPVQADFETAARLAAQLLGLAANTP